MQDVDLVAREFVVLEIIPPKLNVIQQFNTCREEGGEGHHNNGYASSIRAGHACDRLRLLKRGGQFAWEWSVWVGGDGYCAETMFPTLARWQGGLGCVHANLLWTRRGVMLHHG